MAKTFKDFINESEPRAEDKFKKGDKVKDNYGEHFEVTGVSHPMVSVRNANKTGTMGTEYHHTKLHKVVNEDLDEATYKGPIQPGDTVVSMDGVNTVKVADLKGSGFTGADGVYYELVNYKKVEDVIPGEPAVVNESTFDTDIDKHTKLAAEHRAKADAHGQQWEKLEKQRVVAYKAGKTHNLNNMLIHHLEGAQKHGELARAHEEVAHKLRFIKGNQ